MKLHPSLPLSLSLPLPSPPSVWFDSSRVGLIVGFVAWFVNYFPFLFLPGRYETLSL